MAKNKTRNQIIVGISMVPRVRMLTAKEQEQFIKTHPTLKLPTFSLEEVRRVTDSLEEMGQMTDPRTISVATDLSAK